MSGLTINANQSLSAGRSGTPAPDVLGNVTLNSGVVNIGVGAGTIATLSSDGTSTLTLSGGTVNFDLTSTPTSSGGVNDLIDAANLALNGTTTVNVNPVNLSLSNGVYDLFNFNTLSGGTSNLQLAGVSNTGTRQSFSLVISSTSNEVQLAVSGNAANLRWVGAVSSDWNVVRAKNWNNDGSADYFFNNDLVTFSDSASTGSVVLAGNLSPGVMTFNNNPWTILSRHGNDHGQRQSDNDGQRYGGAGQHQRQHLHRRRDDRRRHAGVGQHDARCTTAR